MANPSPPAVSPMQNSSMIEVVFKVSGATRIGEELRVSGNAPALGCDDPERAVPMYTSPNDYPRWRTKEAVYLSGDPGAVRYRYCVFSGGVFNRWEADDISRVLVIEGSENTYRADRDTLGVLSTPTSSNRTISKGSYKIASNDSLSFKSRQFAEWGRRSRIDGNLRPTDGVIIVAFFLPVSLHRSTSGKWSAQWDNENILSLDLGARATFVGCVRYLGLPVPVDEEEAVSIALMGMNCHPIFIDQHTHYQFYDVFCKQHLWLLLHHVADVYGPLKQSDIGAKGQQDLWFTYSTVNRIFRDKVVEVFQAGDLVWIHGFHLMLLPSFLRRFLQVAKIGYFFHTPFPSSEIWRTMTRREDLLRGILAADQIGFHLYEYARHFLTTCHRLIGVSSEMNAAGTLTVNVDGREVAITCIHVGVDLPHLQQALAAPQFEVDVNKWREKFPRKTIVAGIDRLERLKGIPLKLIAIEQFLEEEPHWRSKLLFSMIGISALERGDDYRQTQLDIKVRVARINSLYAKHEGDTVVHFEERKEKDIRLAQRLAFFASADVLMITPTRDGLNRLPMEFTLARHQAGLLHSSSGRGRTEGAGLSNQGVAIVSEFISSARVMRGALIVNPWKVDEVKLALSQALGMSESDRSDRMRRNLEFSTRLTTVNWAKEVLRDLKCVEKSSDLGDSYAVGFGMGFRVMGVKAGFLPLDVGSVSRAYRGADSRLIVLDWGGTLVAENDKVDKLQAYAVAKGHATRAGPTQALKETLEALCSDEKNVVFVVSGKELYAVSEFFGDVQGLGLGAEHGFYYRWPQEREDMGGKDTGFCPLLPTPTANKRKWETIHAIGDQSWKLAARVVMEVYVQRTHGTYVECKGNELIWQFRDADPEFGYLQSKELEQHLKEVMSLYEVEILRGGGVSDGYIEVRPKGVSKGLFVDHAIDIMKANNRDPSFILCIGDDRSDEAMFEHLNAILGATATCSIDGARGRSNSIDRSGGGGTSGTSGTGGVGAGGGGSAGGGVGVGGVGLVLGSASADRGGVGRVGLGAGLGVRTGSTGSMLGVNTGSSAAGPSNPLPPYPPVSPPPVSIFSVTVGKKPSAAQSFVDDPAAVIDLLNVLVKAARRDKINSSNDLNSPSYSSMGSPGNSFSFSNDTDTRGMHSSKASSSGNLHVDTYEVSVDASGPVSPLGQNPPPNRRSPTFSPTLSPRGDSRDDGRGDSSNASIPLGRSMSGAHLSVSQYLESIDEGECDEQDDGLFF